MSVVSLLRRRSTVSSPAPPPSARPHRRSASISSIVQQCRRRSNSSSARSRRASSSTFYAALLPSEHSTEALLVASAQVTRRRRISGQPAALVSSSVASTDGVQQVVNGSLHAQTDARTRARRARDSYLADPKLACPTYDDPRLVQVLWPAPPLYLGTTVTQVDPEPISPIEVAHSNLKAMLTPKSKVNLATPPWLAEDREPFAPTNKLIKISSTASIKSGAASIMSTRSGGSSVAAGSPKNARRALTKAWMQVSAAFRRDGERAMPQFDLVAAPAPVAPPQIAFVEDGSARKRHALRRASVASRF